MIPSVLDAVASSEPSPIPAWLIPPASGSFAVASAVEAVTTAAARADAAVNTTRYVLDVEATSGHSPIPALQMRLATELRVAVSAVGAEMNLRATEMGPAPAHANIVRSAPPDAAASRAHFPMRARLKQRAIAQLATESAGEAAMISLAAGASNPGPAHANIVRSVPRGAAVNRGRFRTVARPKPRGTASSAMALADATVRRIEYLDGRLRSESPSRYPTRPQLAVP